jgi:O-antigen ligase
MIAIYLLTLLYPMDGLFIKLNLNWADYIRIYWYEVLSIILFIVMLLRYLVTHHSLDGDSAIAKTNSDRWILFFLAAFVIWSISTVLWSDYLDRTLFSWFKFNCLFIYMSFILVYLDSYGKFVRLMTFYCSVSAILAIAAIYATYHAFLIKYGLLVTSHLSLSVEVSLFNRPGKVLDFLSGMIVGTGLSSKHELGMYLLGGVVFALFLMRHYKSIWIRCAFLLLILLLETVMFLVLVKLTILGSLIFLVSISLIVTPWRRSVAIILACFILLNVTAYSLSQTLMPSHMKHTESTGTNIEKASQGSEYSDYSYPYRARYWRRAMERIQESHGMGNGPDSSWWDIGISPHAHNLILTMAIEYGLPGVFFIVAALFLIARNSYYQVFRIFQVSNNIWLLKLACVITAGLALFEYSFDVLIWCPQLWYMVGLLWASLRLGPVTRIG